MHIINRSDGNFNIAAVEVKYDAKYMGMWCLKTKGGYWAETPSYIFYAHDPDKSLGHTHYFGLFSRGGGTYITKGDSAFTDLIGIKADDGEIVISRYRHDYHVSDDESVWIDGGRDYIRSSRGGVNVEVVADKFMVGGVHLDVKREEQHGDLLV